MICIIVSILNPEAVMLCHPFEYILYIKYDYNIFGWKSIFLRVIVILLFASIFLWNILFFLFLFTFGLDLF